MQTENTYVETDLGNIALNPRGEYSDETSYEYLDTVSYKGGSYMCLAELTKTISGIAPAQGKNTEHWQVLTIPGGLTSDYIAMHDDVVNKTKRVETSRAAVELSQQEIEAAQADVSQMWQDTQEASEEAAASRDSAAGYAQSAEASRTAAKESEDNINAQVTRFDTHVAEKTSAAETAITEARRVAVNAVSTKQDDATQAVIDEGDKQIKNVEDAGTEQVGKAESAGASAVSAASAAGVSAVNAVKAQQTASIKAVADEGTQQMTAVNTAGSTQVSTIETKGADRVKAIQEAGKNALQNISNGVDKGLSEEGKAADAKATGEAISNLTEELTDITDVIELKSINVFDVNNLIMGKIKNTWEGQTINDVSNSENGYYTDTIYNVKKGDVIRSSTNYIIASFYDKQGKYVTRYNFDTSKEYEIANDNICKMIIMCAENDAAYTTKLMVTINNDMPDNYVPYSGLSTQYNIPKKINEIDSELKKVIKTPFVILNFDAFTELDERYKIINEYGFKASAVASGDKNVNDALQKKGWDIALYGYTGWPYDLNDIDVEADTDEAKKIWENYVNSTIDNAIKVGVYNPTAWNCRKNRFCENLGYALQKAGIKMARGDCWKDGKRIAGEYYTDAFSYCTLTYGLYPSTVNTCLSKIDYAVENNYGINIFTHKIYDTESDATANYGCTKQNLIDVLEKIKYYHDKGKLNVLTYREVYQLYFKNDSDNYDYNRLFKKIINDKQNNTNNSLMIQEGNIVDVVTIENMSSGYIDKAGQLCSNDSAKTTDFIDISDYIIYLTANKQYETKLCGIYDINKNFIAILDDMLIGQTSKSDLCTVENLKIDFEAIQNIYPTAYYYRICTYIPSKGFKLSYKQKISVLDYIKTEKNEVTKFNILYGKKYVSCGDSYTEGDFSGYTDENGLSGKNSPVIYDTNRKMYKTYPWWIAERNNMTLINEAKCGTTITNAFNGERNPFSVSRYLAIPTDVDYVTLMFGLNETGLTDEQIGSKTDTDNTTLWGAYNIVFKHFLTNMPLAKIGVIIADAWMNEKYANAVKEICKDWGIPVLDLKFDTSITAGIDGRTGMNSDAISLRNKVFALKNGHPSVEAHRYRSTIIEHFLRSL